MIFAFIIRYFGFLKHVPGLPHVFDALLRLYTLLIKPDLLTATDEIEIEVSSWPGITTQLHKYGGLQFNAFGKELGHIHSNGLMDMPLSRAQKNEVMQQDSRVQNHHTFRGTGWVSVYMQDKSDKELVIDLFKKAYLKRSRLNDIFAYAQ